MLYGKRSDQVRKLMDGDLIELSGFEEVMTSKYPITKNLHWHRQIPEWKCAGFQNSNLANDYKSSKFQARMTCNAYMTKDGISAESGSLFCALAYFFEHFAHDAVLQGYPEPKTAIGTPKELGVLNKLPNSEKTPPYFLRWLVILLGDLHQPLHWLHEYDFGKEVKVSYKGETFDLQTFWEREIIKKLKPLPRDIGVKKKGPIPPTDTDKDYQVRVKEWEHKLPTELFQNWAEEAAQKVCSEVYAEMEVNHADGKREMQGRGDKPFEIPDELYGKWQNLAEGLIKEAGERIAFVLQDILEHRRHKIAHKLGRGHVHRTMSASSNFFWNVAMAAMIVPSFLYAARWHYDTGHKMVFGAHAGSKGF